VPERGATMHREPVRQLEGERRPSVPRVPNEIRCEQGERDRDREVGSGCGARASQSGLHEKRDTDAREEQQRSVLGGERGADRESGERPRSRSRAR